MLIGAGLGVIAAAVAIGVGTAALAARGVGIELDPGDYAWLLGGGAAAAALWAAIGVGLGAIVRNQVPAVAGVCAWLLFVETVLLGDNAILGDVGRFTPGALGRAATGQQPLLARASPCSCWRSTRPPRRPPNRGDDPSRRRLR